MVYLSFNDELTSTADLNRTLVSNIRRAIVKKLAVKFEGNEIMCIEDFDILTCFKMEYGNKLNPEHSLRTAKGIKGIRQKVIVTHNPSMIDQNEDLLIRFPNLGSDDIIILGMVNLSFNIELTSTADLNRT